MPGRCHGSVPCCQALVDATSRCRSHDGGVLDLVEPDRLVIEDDNERPGSKARGALVGPFSARLIREGRPSGGEQARARAAVEGNVYAAGRWGVSAWIAFVRSRI